MFGKIDLILFSLLLNCQRALLQPIDDVNVDTTTLDIISKVSNTEITEVNKLEDINEKTLKVTEIIQQIDVKENQEQIINRISDVVINNDPITETIKDTNDELNNINKASNNNNAKSTENVDNTSLSWRSDKRNKKKISKTRRAQDPPVSLRDENTKDSESSNNTGSDDPNIFLVINGENVNNISLDSNGLQIKADILINLKVSDSILLNKLINMTKTPYDIISNLLQTNSKNIFLFLNPGNTSNTTTHTVNSRMSHNPNINKSKVKKHEIILPTDDNPPIDIRFGSEDNNPETTEKDTKDTNNRLHITEKPNKDSLLSNLLPGPLLDFDLPIIPVDDIFGTAANIFNRFK
ncbi:hypothetical protein B5X24_HaOG216420 [Helicoverpa armigera]|nr:hypothetical protein B5X24_HaOG216420 [Helicoverpa armigera]